MSEHSGGAMNTNFPLGLNRIFNMNRQPIVASVLYVVFIPAVVGSLLFVSVEFLRAQDLEAATMLGFFCLFMGLNSFALPRFVRYQEPGYPARPLTAMEAVLLTTAYLTVFMWSQDGFHGSPWSIAWRYTLAGLALTTAGLIFNYRVQKKSLRQGEVGRAVDEDDVRSIVHRCINSGSFISALQTTLPKAEGGSDATSHIPFILATLQERRQSFNRSSQLFFVALLLFAAMFTALLTVYGFILIDSVPVGVARSIKEAREEIGVLRQHQLDYESLGQSLRRYESSALRQFATLIKTPEDASRYGRGVEAFVSPYLRGGRLEPDAFIRYDTARADERSLLARVDQFKLALADLKLAQAAAAASSSPVAKAAKQMSDDEPRVSALASKVGLLSARYESTRTALDNLIERAKANETDPDDRLYALLKRIAVGVIVGSFFFAILRYLAQQYASHLSKYESSHADEVMLRKFYLAYDITEKDPEKQKGLIAAFLGNSPASTESPPPSAKKQDLGDSDKKIIAEILEIIKKRM